MGFNFFIKKLKNTSPYTPADMLGRAIIDMRQGNKVNQWRTVFNYGNYR